MLLHVAVCGRLRPDDDLDRAHSRRRRSWRSRRWSSISHVLEPRGTASSSASAQQRARTAPQAAARAARRSSRTRARSGTTRRAGASAGAEAARGGEQQRRQAEEQQLRERQEAERKRAGRGGAAAQGRGGTQAGRRDRTQAEGREPKRRKAADDARRAAAREDELRSQLEEEEGRTQAANAGLLNQYIAMIEQRIVRNWNRPPSARAGLECEVRVAQTPGGTVLSVQIGQLQRRRRGQAIDRSGGDAFVAAAAAARSAAVRAQLVLVFKPLE